MTSDLCSCGLIKRAKVGTRQLDGVEFCLNCNKPTEISRENAAQAVEVASAATAAQAVGALGDYLMITTLDFLPGYEMTRTLGVVSATMSHTAWKANTQKARLATAFDGAMELLWRNAKIRGANSIVGLQMAANSSEGGSAVFGGSSDGVVLMGTAALMERNLRETAVAEAVRREPALQGADDHESLARLGDLVARICDELRLKSDLKRIQ